MTTLRSSLHMYVFFTQFFFSLVVFLTAHQKLLSKWPPYITIDKNVYSCNKMPSFSSYLDSITYLFNEAENSSYYIASMIGQLLCNELETMWKANLRYCSGICMEVMRTMKNFSLESRISVVVGIKPGTPKI
jgi:hypothetical protein